MILKKGFLTELKKKFSKRQYNVLGRARFWWVGRSTANQHFFKVGLTYNKSNIPYKYGRYVEDLLVSGVNRTTVPSVISVLFKATR